MAENELTLDREHKIAVAKLVGDQTRESLTEAIEGLLKLNTEQMRLFGHIASLIDISELGKHDLGARLAAVQGIGQTLFDRVAIYDPDGDNHELVETVIGLAGKAADVKFFKSRDEAISWLTI